MEAALTLDELRQPTCTETLSPAMRRYLEERVAALAAPRGHGRQACTLRLYQCLGDPGSARTLAEDLCAFVIAGGAGGFVALFECPCNGDALRRHLALMHRAEPGIAALPPTPDNEADDDDFRLRVLDQEFGLIALHPEATRLSRVLPCPALLFRRP